MTTSLLSSRTRRDLTKVSTASLERNSAQLLDAIRKLDGLPYTNVEPLKDGLADVEAELIDRLIEDGRHAEWTDTRDENDPERIRDEWEQHLEDRREDRRYGY